MKIAIGSDHRGFSLKEAIKKYLNEQNYDIKDFGSSSIESTDYPDYALPVAEAVVSGGAQKGILICGSGIGVSMAANKVPGIRAALVFNSKAAEMTAMHNNPNVLCMSEETTAEDAFEMVKAWLETPFEGGRHLQRINKITAIEKKYSK